MTETIELKDLTTGYRVKGHDKTVSAHINASLSEGQLTCMLGPNGAGKSTLLRTLAGFQKPLDGSVYIGGQDIRKTKPHDMATRVSVVMSMNSDIRNMTADEVVALGRSPYTGFWGRLSPKDKKAIDKCMAWMGIEHLRTRKMNTLSDGERQKVMIAKAIAQETPVVLLDEPTAFLDYPSKVSMMMLLHRLAHALHKTIFLSTHDLEQALQVADQIWLIDQEKGLTTGMPEDLSAQGEIERYFCRKGIAFDRLTLALSVEHEYAREVICRGQEGDLHYGLLRHALQRNAIRPITSAAEATLPSTMPDICVEAQPGGSYSLHQPGHDDTRTQTIGQLVGLLNTALVHTQIQAIGGDSDSDQRQDGAPDHAQPVEYIEPLRPDAQKQNRTQEKTQD